MPQMQLTKDQHSVQTLAAHGPDQALHMAILRGDPGEIGRSRIPIALSSEREDMPVCSVIVAHQISRR